MPFFSAVEMVPGDPILGLSEAFSADVRPNRVNLGIGVYSDEAGHIPLLESVRTAERQLINAATPHPYLPIDGLPAYIAAAQQLLFGTHASELTDEKLVTVQTLGGTGALRIGADFLHRLSPRAKVAISQPSWPNHQAVFAAADFEIVGYPYYNVDTRALDFSNLLASLENLVQGDIVVLHACCHNPTGIDPTPAQWEKIIGMMQEHQLVAFLDIAYQGFGAGVEEDSRVVRQFTASSLPVFVAHSFSKSFSLYGERVGALSVVCESAEEAGRVRSQLKQIIRADYSNPPTFGAAVVSRILTTLELNIRWREELTSMRLRIREMRRELVGYLQQADTQIDFNFLLQQQGMFSFSGLNQAQVRRLQDEFGIYVLDNGRICVAALNPGNVDYVAQAITTVSRR